MDSARSRSMSGGSSPADILRDYLFKLPGGAGTEISRDMEGIERIRDAPASGGKPPAEMSPQELHSVLWRVLSFRDSGTVISRHWVRFLTAVLVAKTIEKTIGRSSVNQCVLGLNDNTGYSRKNSWIGFVNREDLGVDLR